MPSETYDTNRLMGQHVTVWPYSESLFPPDTFFQMWKWMEEDGTLACTFHEHEKITLPELVLTFNSRIFPARLLLLVTDKFSEGAGFIWFDDVKQGHRAMGNICMRKKYWGKAACEAAKIAMDYVFGVFDVKHLYGFIPCKNTKSMAFARRIGFREVSRIPNLASYNGGPTDLIVFYIRRKG